jgi:creatinine amidohydrolase
MFQRCGHFMIEKLSPRTLFARVVLGFFISMLSLTGASAGSEEVQIERLSWVDVGDRLAHGASTILIPTGGTEQNGPHMALGKHNLIVRETARRVALQLGNALVAPVLAYVPEGAPDKKLGHMAYPGTVSLTEEVFEKVLENAAWSFKTHGFKRIVFLGDSGGNQGPQQRVAERLSKAWEGEGVIVLNAAAYYGSNGGMSILKSHGLNDAQIGTHAGVRDTSELMFVDPDAVDLSKAVADAQGARGDARLANAEWGRQLIEKKVAAAVAEIRARTAGTIVNSNAKAEGFLGWLFSFVTG